MEEKTIMEMVVETPQDNDGVKNDMDKDQESDRKTFEFSNLSEKQSSGEQNNMDIILDVALDVAVELGRKKMTISDLLKLTQGSVIELTKLAGETLEILANHKLIARGEVVVINDKYGVRLTEIISPVERLEGLK